MRMIPYTVVPAKAGAHTPCTLDSLVVMDPRFRGDDIGEIEEGSA
jgi:hypothetical protein